MNTLNSIIGIRGNEFSLGIWTGFADWTGANPGLFSVVLVVLALLVGGLWILNLTAGRRRRPRNFGYEMIAEAAGDAFFELDVATRRLEWRSYAGLGEIADADKNGLQIGIDYSRVHPDDRDALHEAWEGVSRGNKVDVKIRFAQPGRTWSWFSMNVAPVRDRAGKFPTAIGVVRSTNDLHKNQELLAEDRRLDTVGTIAGGIAHEFNNHLTPVRGYLELALDDLPADHPVVDGLKTALDRVIYCSELVAQLQAYGRKSLLVLRSTSLNDVLPEALRVSLSVDRPNAQSVRVFQQLPKDLPSVDMDKTQFRQGINHLIQNAYEAMPNGGSLCIRAKSFIVKNTTRFRTKDAKKGHYVRIEIEDSGVGITENNLESVLDPFFTTRGRASASGMGLPMVHGMMAQHGGFLDIDTIVNRGTTVYLYFPISLQDIDVSVDPAPTIPEIEPTVPEEDATAPLPEEVPDTEAPVFEEPALEQSIPDEPDPAPQTPAAEKPARTAIPAEEQGRMLVADDEPFVRNIVRRIFGDDKWFIEECGSHQEIMDLLDQGDFRFDIAVLDITMPGPPVEDIVQAILRERPSMQILLISGFDHNERVDQMTQNPAVEFMAKPFSPKALTERVDEIMTASV